MLHFNRHACKDFVSIQPSLLKTWEMSRSDNYNTDFVFPGLFLELTPVKSGVQSRLSCKI